MRKAVLSFILLLVFCFPMQDAKSQSYMINAIEEASDRHDNIQESWRLLAADLKKLEQEHGIYVAKSRKIAIEYEEASDKFWGCPNGRWRVVREDDFQRVEEKKEELQRAWLKIRDDVRVLENNNNDLEFQRQTIETNRKTRRKTLVQYNEDMKNLILEYKKEYINPYRNNVFPKYDLYYRSKNDYISFLEGAAEECNSDEFDDSRWENTIEYIVANITKMMQLDKERKILRDSPN